MSVQHGPVMAQGRTLAEAAKAGLSRPVIGQHGIPGQQRPGKGKVAAPAGGDGTVALEQAARSDYLLHCSGCHGDRGEPHEIGRIPPLRDRIGNFLHLAEGRAFLVQVPGVHNSTLDDQRIARLMNWLIPQFAGSSMQSEFQHFDADEVRGLRASRPVDPAQFRKRLARRLSALGYPIDY